MTSTAHSPSPGVHPKDVHAKALAINLDPTTYGSFAEIGAGQEVARWFLRVGGAAGTVAQTISAYDKAFSDGTYGAGTRYVSKDRVIAMLDHEYRLLLERLDATRDRQTRFFVFADTVAARNYHGDNEQHGWLGIRFRAAPGDLPSDLLVHVNLRDATAQLQQEAIGVLGVNLLYATLYQRGAGEEGLLAGAFDELSIDRVELDVIEMSGPAFPGADARRACLAALRRRMCHAVVFDGAGKPVEPSAVLRKRPLIVGRRRFEAVGSVFADMIRAAVAQLAREGLPLRRDPTPILEVSIHPAGSAAPTGDDDTLLAAIEKVRGTGIVLVSDFAETYLLVEYLRRYSTEPIRLVAGTSNLARLMAAEFYGALPGSLLEGLGRLLASNVKVYVESMPKAVFDAALIGLTERVEATSDPVTADAMRFKPPVEHLYRYVRASEWVVPLDPHR